MTAPAWHRRPGPPVFDCECGHAIYDHASYTEPNAGGRTYGGCRVGGCRCDRFRNLHGELFVAGGLRAEAAA